MKTLIQEQISSIVRFILVAYGGWLATQAGVELGTEGYDISTVTELITGTVLALLAYALKLVSGMGVKGRLAASLIGPRVLNMAASISRWLVGLIAGALVAVETETAIDFSTTDLGDTPVSTVVVILVGFAYDRLSKLWKP